MAGGGNLLVSCSCCSYQAGAGCAALLAWPRVPKLHKYYTEIIPLSSISWMVK